MEYSLLDNINFPSDIKHLSKNDISELCSEIRDFLIKTVDERGGHLASNLGVVEMTLAIHSVFDSPRDHIVFDVGHQAYVHKILTGRREHFSELRLPGGLSGFTSRRESEHDAFGAGHSSTSISAALGFAEADALLSSDAHTICVIGDGAYTGGMVHEALNNCKPDLPLVIILNENGMSISLNKGTFASYLSRVRISGGYRRWKRGTKNFLSRIPLVGRHLKRFVTFTKTKIKNLVYRPNYFEELGLYYIGPIDGNDYDNVYHALTVAKQIGATVVVHLKTVKGKGYLPSEKSPDGYHSVTHTTANDTFHSIFAKKLIELAEENKRVVAVTAAMGIGTGLDAFGEAYSDRYFDVGIAEGHALTFSAGLAAGGLLPFVAVYSTFLQRAYDSLLHDIALQELPVKIMIDRAGLAVGDGATHHGIFDVSFISHIPSMTLLAPCGYVSLVEMIEASLDIMSPVAIRYPNAKENGEILSRFHSFCSDILSRVLVNYDTDNPPSRFFITYGKIYENVIMAADTLAKEGIACGVILVETIKPYENTAKIISELIKGAERVVYVEEGIRNGGAAQITADHLEKLGVDLVEVDYRIAAIDDNFASPCEVCDLYDFVRLSPSAICDTMLK